MWLEDSLMASGFRAGANGAPAEWSLAMIEMIRARPTSAVQLSPAGGTDLSRELGQNEAGLMLVYGSVMRPDMGSPSGTSPLPAPPGLQKPETLGAPNRTCPQCGAQLVRIPRRAIDRLVSAFWPVRRYRCNDFQCQWEGNLRQTGSSRERYAERRGRR